MKQSRKRVSQTVALLAMATILVVVSAQVAAAISSKFVWYGVPSGGYYPECIQVLASKAATWPAPPRISRVWATYDPGSGCSPALGRPAGWLDIQADYIKRGTTVRCGYSATYHTTNGTNGSDAWQSISETHEIYCAEGFGFNHSNTLQWARGQYMNPGAYYPYNIAIDPVA
jgi:hypothetical protein